jgi:hypothetical protein
VIHDLLLKGRWGEWVKGKENRVEKMCQENKQRANNVDTLSIKKMNILAAIEAFRFRMV